jgi:uracil-DNA glycosylase family 4
MKVHGINRHLLDWCHCEECPISAFTQAKVFFRGKLPCDVLFVGEAPGDTELVLQKPFVGASGKYLDKVITAVVNELELNSYRIAYTNAIACAPLEDETLRLRPPKKSEISNCSPRLQDFIDLAKPKVIVALGTVAKKAVAKIETNAQTIECIHPSAVIRQGERGSLDHARLKEALKLAFLSL